LKPSFPAARCCTDFSRSAFLRRAAAEAGRGLPAIEPGMPLPAGTGLDRRAFLARSAGVLLSVYGAARIGLPGLDEGIARAAATASTSDPVLVSVFLDGGVDSLSVLFPTGDPRYRRLRRSLALPGSAGTPFAEDDRLRWHPAAAGLAALHGEGKLSVLPAVGYTGADQSHFTSRHYWEVGATDAGLRTGWLGRYLDRTGAPDNPLQGLSLDWQLQPVLASARVPVSAVSAPDDFDFWTSGVWGQVEGRLLETLAPLGQAGLGSGDRALAEAGGVTLQTQRLREQLAPFAGDEDAPAFTSPVAYPTGDEFPERLAALAAMLAAGLPLRCVALTAPGRYDTHADQADELSEGIQMTADSLLAFQRDLEARGLADRVLVHVWSEFGRRAEENGSRGTDHGAAGIGFLMGSRVRGRMIGEFPGLGTLDDDGNLRATSDFRGVYAALVEQWLGGDAEGIVPGASRFERPTLLR
jgi:uncharacterized protein (DUF1501 family)